MRGIAIAIASTWIGCAALAFGACSSTSSTPDEAGVPDSALADGSYGASACAACVAQECARAQRACEGEVSCAAHLVCLRACPEALGGNADETCARGCSPDGGSSSAYEAWAECRSHGAGSRCEPCGPPTFREPRLNQQCEGATVPPIPDDAGACKRQRDEIDITCRNCVYLHCCESRNKCDRDLGCFELRDCLVNPCEPDGGTFATCFERNPAGVAQFAELRGCQVGRCSFECGVRKSPCRTCWFARCADELSNYHAMPDGILHGECGVDCADGDAACRATCDQRYPEAAKVFAVFQLCVDQRCADVCPE